MKMQKIDTQKMKWLGLLFLAISAFVLALTTGQLIFNLVAIVLALIVYKYGSPVLFKEYDARKKEKYEDTMVVQKAAQQAITQKKIFKK